MMTPDFKTPPYSLWAEQAVVGSIMLDNQRLYDVEEILVKTDFYHLEHQLIFNAIGQLSLKKGVFDVITLSDYLREKNELSQAGRMAYIVTIARDTL